MKLFKILSGAAPAVAIAAGAVMAGRSGFSNNVNNEVNELFSQLENNDEKALTLDSIDHLPEPARRYLKYSCLEGEPIVNSARIIQGGSFRASIEQPWFPLHAEQYFTTHVPGFVWKGELRINPLVWINARDKYISGKGGMLIKFLSLVKAGDEEGREIDSSCLLRWLAEAVWFPSVFLTSDKITWEPIDSGSCRLIVQDSGMKLSAVVYINREGELTRIVSEDRFMNDNGENRRESWTGLYRNYRQLNGYHIPTEVEAIWNLEEGDFSYAKITVDDIEYNKPELF